ncbi:MAG: glucoamylase family protein [Planctomycetota bacterium]
MDPWRLAAAALARAAGPRPRGARERNRFGPVARFRLLDNLLRSLVSPALVALAAVGWSVVPGAALASTLVVLVTLAAPVWSGLLSTVLRCASGARVGPTLANGLTSARLALGRWAATVALLPFEAYVATDAIARTLWRLAVSRRRLLEWTPAAHAARDAPAAGSLAATTRRMLAAPAMAVLTAIAVAARAPGALPAALPLLVAWFLSPLVAYRLGLRRAAGRETIDAEGRRALRVAARRTWLFFEQFVGPSDHWLPPDNFQEEPGGRVARRTSPTNVGLSLLSTLGAHDLGYVGLLGLEARLRSTFDTLDRLERHRGHLFNWYETQHLAPLEPRYVSTVDSGNLVGCLWALASGCEDVVHTPVVRPAQAAGVLDTIDVLGETLGRTEAFGADGASRAAQEALGTLRARFEPALGPRAFARVVREVQGLELPRVEEQLARLAECSAGRADPAAVADLRLWAARLRERITFVHRELSTLGPWLTLGLDVAAAATTPGEATAAARIEAVLDGMPEAPALEDVPAACDAAVRLLAAVRDELGPDPAAGPEGTHACDAAAASLSRCATDARGLVERFRRLVVDARRQADATDFAFLFDPRRRLLHLGYDASAGRLDPNHYDLLASESRLASFVGIAKGDLPARHWLHLGRPLARLPGGPCLRSWSGTMFEYLMPGLLLRAPARTLLGESCDTAVVEQIAAGRRSGRPWGTSESGFAELDAGGAYGYWAFGARSLALRRDVGARDVIAPYASALACPRRPSAVLANLQRLRTLGMLGRFGFYEALDYGPVGEGRIPTPVRSYMAHHEAMILLALCNTLHDDVFVARLGADARVRAFDLLLDERLPTARTPPPVTPEVPSPSPTSPPPSVVTSAVSTRALPPRTTILSNGRLSSWITAAGGGGLRWRDLALTRWRADGWEEGGGTWVYLRDEAAGATWSVGERPVPAPPGLASARFGPHVVELQRREHGLLARVDVAVAPWDDVEVRRITLVNEDDRPRTIRVTTAVEVLLAAVGEARRHPAFSRLFVESELLPTSGGIHVRRRPRSPDDEPVHVVQCLVGGGSAAGPRSFETDRGRFVGRHGTDRAPAGVGARPLNGRAGATLDPILAISTLVRLAPGGRTTLTLLTSVAGSRERALELIEAHRGAGAAEAVFEQARRERERALRDLGISPADARIAHELLSACLAPGHAVRAEAGPFDAAARPRSELWGHGISGDLPIVLLRLAATSDLRVAFETLRLHAYLLDRGAALDVVLLDEEPTGYASPRRDGLEAERARLRALGLAAARGGSFVIPRDRVDAAAVRRLEAWAAVVLDDDRPVAAQLERLDDAVARLPAFAAVAGAATPDLGPAVERPSGLRHDNGYGGFPADGPGYVVYARPGHPTPAPWGNVLANADFGCFVTEAGSGWTWRTNSAEHRLTPWRNDPVRDDPGEALYLRDEETGVVWTPTPLPIGGGAPVLVRHRPATTTFERRSHGLGQELTLAVASDAPVKVVTLRLANLADRPRRLTVTYYVEWVLGTSREATAAHLLTAYEDGALLARNPTSDSFATRVAFLASDAPATGMTCDRVEFLGAGGVRDPAGLRRIGLSGAVGGRLDPCGALQVSVDLPARAVRDVRFVLGEGVDLVDARRLLAAHRAPRVATAVDATAAWDRVLGAIEVSTPDPDFDLLMNGRLLHQVVACRMWGRSGLYQPGGAFGFRDQLQDAMALVSAAPALARAHLLEAARRQFPEGDVLHWWHVETDAGVRTRCSDDRLWLPFAVAHYVRWTGDHAVLDAQVPFLAGEPLAPGERERYARFAPGPVASLAEHCLRALERDPGTGTHGLPLMGSGDWNDGMNRVGADGRGESVWLAWFLYAAWTRFAAACPDGELSARCGALRRRAEALRATVERTAWDGRWYLRAFYDDGTPLGGSASDEARIDLVSQAWAVLSGAANRSRAARAMASAADHLLVPALELVRLLAPPFDRTALEPGYVKGYPPGVRENGAQYTHAAVWGAWAFAVLGDGDTALDWFRTASPIRRTSTRAGADLYRVEPYVVAGDVCLGGGYDGRGGWTWYTGSAAWLYRLGLERILGVRRTATTLAVDPCVPAAWSRFEVVLRTGATVHRVRVENPDGISRGVASATLDGRAVPSPAIPFVDDGAEHAIVVVLGAPESAV